MLSGNMKKTTYRLILFFLLVFVNCKCDTNLGPDPWNNEDNDVEWKIKNDIDVPPDLRVSQRRRVQSESNLGMGEWFFKRVLAIVLKGGQVKKNEDGTVDVLVQMRFVQEHWKTLDEYVISNTALTEDKFRRSVGYLEEAIYKPTITEKIVMAWQDYIQIYIEEYKVHIKWTLCILSAVVAFIWLWKHMSHRHLIVIIVILLYLYEVFVSYKEAEQQELDKFLSAINKCKWYFWTSECDVPPPDALIFLKHMNPLKIGLRMFTTIISEPLITISATMKVMIHGITDGLWFPFDKIVYGMLIVTFNVLLIFLFIMIIFNYLLNIPFNLNLFLGLVSIGLVQRKRNLNINNDTKSNEAPSVESEERISGETLNRILDVVSHALTGTKNRDADIKLHLTNSGSNTIRRSASTGRLPNLQQSSENNNRLALNYNVRRRNNAAFDLVHTDGSGDAH